MDHSELMNKPLKAKRKTVGKNGQNYWNDIGITVWLGDYNGQPTVSLVDERTGEQYPCFAPMKREDRPPSTPDPQYGPEEDVPF